MIQGIPSIIVIDDNLDELDNIKSAFFRSGIPCLPIQYISNEPENDSGIDHIDTSYWTSPRVVVSDLNLAELPISEDATNLAGPFAKMLKKLDLKGPYLLCVWSKLESKVNDVIAILEERYSEEITLPTQVSTISKTTLLNNPDALKIRLEELISENALFSILMKWEFRISEASRSTVSALYSLAKNSTDDKSIEGQAIQLRKVLAAIGNEALGEKNALDSPALAMDYGLVPVMEDQIRSISGNDLDEKWKEAVPEIGSRQNIEESIKSKLNSFYHIEEVEGNYPKINRGVFVSLNQDYLDENREKFERRIGRPLKNLLHEEFLPKTNGKSTAQKSFRQKAREHLILGFLEISPACDYAQRKTKFPRYILGALIPEQYGGLTSWETNQGTPKNTAHDGIFRLPMINYRGDSYIVKFSFKYQIGTQPDDNQWFGQSMFRVRDQILSNITFSCSQYASRPGIVGFF